MSDTIGPDDSAGSASGSRLRLFFTSLPGLITAIAALLTAVVGAVVVLGGSGGEGQSDAAVASTAPSSPRNGLIGSTPPPGPGTNTGSQDAGTAELEGTLAAQDRDWVNLSKGYLVDSFDGRADFRVVKDLNDGVITLLGDTLLIGQLAQFAVIDDEITKQNCYAGLRSRRQGTYDVAPGLEGEWICVQTTDESIAAIRIDRVDVLEGALDLSYVVWK
ncbi:hypothetical protein O7627_27500 [Solwaraspora sp. WMMD1047]|uniref:hypothetical protein n=1 Tax=Solwaraspora sp. WMMD1047 TaxID=3016102 RepID=UPI0024173DA5|nr:hypothetical protein [Solwaraspora sp. WMMD1047]MDG4833023.1 hypothetical protein [Solwaraspora sp. WMMD1047]